MSTAMIWFLCATFIGGLGLWYALRENKGWVPAILFVGCGSLLVAISFLVATGVATADFEIWNGKIVDKDRVHGTYEQSYSCNCRTVTSGSGQNATSRTECDTCYETHYTVTWTCYSTIGDFEIEKFDRTSSSVYASPDPQRWTEVKLGDPVAKKHHYTNYIQAVPESLFKPAASSLKAKFSGLVPAYPIDVFDFYKVNRFLTPGYASLDASLWNQDISMMLRDLGPAKQVNAIVVIAKTDDPDFEYALRDAWGGAKKNDVVLIIGSKNWPQIDFVRVLTWSKAELFKIELRDNVEALGTVDRVATMALLEAQISKNFVRRQMREFKYLETEIDPPTWLMAVVAALLIIGAGGIYAQQTGMMFKSRYSSRFRRF